MRPKVASLAVSAALVTLLAGVALAGSGWTIPNGGVFWACYESGGNVKFIDYSATQTCPKGWIGPVSWSQTGPQGPAGSQGDIGPAGPAGADGASGPAGPAGPQGDMGPKGDTGAQGDVGPAGPAGATGDVGPAGPAGATGDIGPAGPAGPQGDVGPKGDTGATGDIGPAGPAGPQGDIGPAGPAFIGSACTYPDGSSGTVAMTVGAGGAIAFTCTGGGGTGGGGGIACAVPAPEYPNMVVACDETTGTYQASCMSGFADANGTLSDGCEVDLMTDPANCGAVGNQIPTDGTDHATYGCVNGTPTLLSCEVGWTDVNGSIVDGCETAGDPDASGNVLPGATVIGTMTCGQTYTVQGSIANAADNDWYSVAILDGASCSGFEVALTSGGSPSTYAVFDVLTSPTTVLVADQTTLSVSAGSYSSGGPIYIRVHASGDGPYGEYRLTLQH